MAFYLNSNYFPIFIIAKTIPTIIEKNIYEKTEPKLLIIKDVFEYP